MLFFDLSYHQDFSDGLRIVSAVGSMFLSHYEVDGRWECSPGPRAETTLTSDRPLMVFFRYWATVSDCLSLSRFSTNGLLISHSFSRILTYPIDDFTLK